MNIFSKIDIPIFLVSFMIGLFMCYLTHPQPKIIIKYPTPDGDDIFIDDTNTCYKYFSEEVKCPDDKSLINEIPIQQTLFN